MQHSRPLGWLALSIAGFAACHSKPERTQTVAPSNGSLPAIPAASGGASSGGALSGSGSSGSGSSALADLSESDVKAFVIRWTTAQNEHDFAAYSALYGERFMGVKRVGTYSKRFDRAAWLLDRKPMFEAGAQVRVADLTLMAAAGATRAVFTQEFTATGFRDIGKKELFLVPTPSGIAISREEMLSSQVSEGEASAERVLAYQRDGVVVQRGFDKRKLPGGPRLLSPPNASPVEIGFSVAPDALSESARGWLGKQVTAYTSTGDVCSGKVARFEVRVQAVPHFGMRQAWNGEQNEPKASPAIVAQAIARLAQSEEHFVVGVLDHACAGSWASAATQAFVKATVSEGKLRAAGIAAFKALPAYGNLQKNFVKESGEAARPWETVNGDLRVMELRAPGRQPLLLVAARAGGGCAGFNGSLSAFWNVAGTADAPTLKAIAPSLNEYITLHGALDAAGEPGPALLSGPDNYDDQLAVLRLTPKVIRRVVFATSFWDCDC